MGILLVYGGQYTDFNLHKRNAMIYASVVRKLKFREQYELG